ncbi:16S rRNA (cytidine(1402)-2'-O)-methyltransferase [Stomatohabitans albus]|uniref:16S rRNA (cytidine(1402)-2'-O)-methyltransferase n=1 Tax=Stomatohabitans albus TaxID=3110766 RepID=UPI00300D836D
MINTKHEEHTSVSGASDTVLDDDRSSSAIPPPSSGLVVVATPIGNLGDLSPRAHQALATADVIACEDTRRTGALCHKLDISTGRMVVHDHNERDQASQIVERIRRGETVALVSDAGTPGISDPGHHVINAVLDAQLPVTAIPGPVAAIMALTLSGLPTDRFTFEGFLPRKAGQRNERLAALMHEERTMVFYVAPHRVSSELEAMASTFGDNRPACLARELTKVFEEFVRLPLGELAQRYHDAPPKGEVVVVVGGAPNGQQEPLDDTTLRTMVADLVDAGVRLKDATKQVAAKTGRSARELYAMMNEAPKL